jgi:hypothetical protein
MFGTECFSGYDSQCCRYGEHGLGADEKTMRRAITNIVDFARRLSEVFEFRNQLTFDMDVVDLRMEDLLAGQVYEEVDFAVAWEVEQVFQLTSPAMPSARPEYWVRHEAL